MILPAAWVTELLLRQVVAHVLKYEGYRAHRYKDSRGIWTIGIGFNLEDPTAKTTCELYGLNWQALIDGNASMVYFDAVKVCSYKICGAAFSAAKIFAAFQSLPDSVKIVVLDMLFNLGAPTFEEFHDTIQAINSGDFKAAAAAMKQSKWYGQVGQRAIDDCALMSAA